MKEMTITMSVSLDGEWAGDTDVNFKVSDELYTKVASLYKEIDEEEMDCDEADEFIEKSNPTLYKDLGKIIDDQMPDNIDMQSGEDISDYSWRPNFASMSI